MKSIFKTFPAVIAVCLVPPVFGGEVPLVLADAHTVTSLVSIVVSASRSETRLDEMPLHTTVVSREDIEKSPAQFLDQLLRDIPGMNFSGVPIHDPFYLTTQWFKVPLSNIERVEIIRGGNSSLWGNMATAGVVNIVSKRVSDSAGELSASVGSKGAANLALSKNFIASDTLSFNLSFDQFHTDGYQTTPAEYLWRFPGKQPVDAKDSNFQVAAYFKPSADLNGYLRLGYHVQDQNISYLYGSNLQKSPDIAAGLTQTLDKTSSITANAWAQYVSFEKYNGNSCYWQASGTKCPSSSSVTVAQINHNIVQYYTQYGSQRYREQGGSVAYSKSLTGFSNGFQFGADYRRLTASDLEYFYMAPTLITKPQNFDSSTYGEGEQTFVGLFGQTRVFPVEPLEITLSGRYDTWKIGDRRNMRTSATGVTTGGALPETTKSAFNPSLAARYEVNSQIALRGAAYQSFRAPGFNNLTRTYGIGTSTNIANPDLGPETLKGWELGTDYHGDAVSFGATYFLYDIKDMIATYTVRANSLSIPAQVTALCGAVVAGGFSKCDSAASVKYYTNDQDGQAHGLELTGKWRLLDDLTLDASYTHTETYLTRRGAIVTDPLGMQLVAVSKDVATFGATWKPDDSLRIYGELRYIGPMPIDTTSVVNHIFEQGGVSVVNFSAAYAWEKNVELSVGVVNLFDREYSENGYTYNQPYNRTLSLPRTVTAGVKWRF